jgi:hypothetical protein
VRSFRGGPNFSRAATIRRVFPRTVLCLVSGTEFAQREFFDKALSLALAGSFAPDFGGDHRYHTDDLRLGCETVWIEVVGRPDNSTLPS